MVYRPQLTINYLFVSQSFDGTRLLYLRIFLGTRLFHCTRLRFKINFLCTRLFGVLVYLIGKSRNFTEVLAKQISSKALKMIELLQFEIPGFIFCKFEPKYDT